LTDGSNCCHVGFQVYTEIFECDGLCGICSDIWKECAASIFRVTDTSSVAEVMGRKESEGYMGQFEEI
jgi:hypothetical protein